MNEQRAGKRNDEYIDPGARRYSFSLFFLPDRPWVPAWISLVAFGFAGVGPLLLGQEGKALLLFGVEWLIVFPLGVLSGALPIFLLLFHAAVALDTWVIARRLQAGEKVRKWEWGWQG